MFNIDEDDSSLVGILIVLALLVGSLYTGYRIGKWKERKDYTLYFIKATQDTYNEAYADGEKAGREEGLEMGKLRCLNEDFDIRDKY